MLCRLLEASRPVSLLDHPSGEEGSIQSPYDWVGDPIRLATSRLETWSWSHAISCYLSKSVSFRRGGMIRTSLTVAKYLFIKPQIWQHFTQRDSCCTCTVQFFFTWLGCARATRSNWGFLFDILYLFVITQHTVREFRGIGMLTQQRPTHCSTRIHSNLF